MKVLITGGAGFIGQHVAHELVRDGHEVVGLDLLLPQVHADAAASRARFPGELIEADVADEHAWSSVPATDHVIHLAAETGTGQSMYEQTHYLHVNVDGTALAGIYASRHGVPLIVASSRAVYGEGSPTVPTTEDSPHRPVSVYGRSKSLAEAAARAAATEGLTMLRPQNVIGPGQALHNPYTGVLAAFLAMLKERRPLTLYGDGLGTRDFVRVSDVAATIAHFVDHPASGQQVFNVGTGRRLTFVELAQACLAASPWPDLGWEHLEVARAGDINHACADLTQVLAAGAPAPVWLPQDAVADFIHQSWVQEGAASQVWDQALEELSQRGLTQTQPQTQTQTQTQSHTHSPAEGEATA